MNRLFITIFTVFCGLICSSQKLNLKILGNSHVENKTIDSISYNPVHLNAKSITDETKLLSQKLNKMGYIENEILDSKKTNDSSFLTTFRLHKKIDFIHIYIGGNLKLKSLSIFDSNKDTIIIKYNEVETFLNQTINKLEKKGYALIKLKLIHIERQNSVLRADLDITIPDKRQLNDIVINGYNKFPDSHKHNLKRLYKNKVFNQENLKKIYSDFNKFRFIKQVKYPEILFTKDSTKVYIYLEKSKANSFDGFIGFSNNDSQKLIFNGYLDLSLNNILNSGENFTINWKSDGENQKTFNSTIELPYLFKSPFGLKAQLNIFKQDSTFQNTKTGIDFGYLFNYNSRLYLGYQSSESSDIQNQNTTSISDFKNQFTTSNFEYINYKSNYFLFPEKTKINIKVGFGNRTSKLNSNKQQFINIDFKHNIYINEKNSLTLKSQNYYLNSNAYIINELYRFGGINSIRGFNENSLQATLFSSLMTEYNYLITPNIYAHTIIDYGYYEDKTINNQENVIGLGFGFGILTKNGLFNIIYANGSAKNQTIKGSDSIVHVSFKTNF